MATTRKRTPSKEAAAEADRKGLSGSRKRAYVGGAVERAKEEKAKPARKPRATSSASSASSRARSGTQASGYASAGTRADYRKGTQDREALERLAARGNTLAKSRLQELEAQEKPAKPARKPRAVKAPAAEKKPAAKHGKKPPEFGKIKLPPEKKEKPKYTPKQQALIDEIRYYRAQAEKAARANPGGRYSQAGGTYRQLAWDRENALIKLNKTAWERWQREEIEAREAREAQERRDREALKRWNETVSANNAAARRKR